MLLQALTAALTLLMSAQEAPAADPEADALAELHARAAKRCESDPRTGGETIEACSQRRARALLDTYGSTAGALAATARWSGSAPSETGALGFPTFDEAMADQQARPAGRAPDQPWQPPQPRCRRETTRSEDGNTVSTSLVCGNNPEAQNAAREMLERVRNPD